MWLQLELVGHMRFFSFLWKVSVLEIEHMIICGKEMEPLNPKSLERVVSQRAFQMGSSFPCQLCVVGFLCGVCLTSLFLAALTSFGASAFVGISFSTFSTEIPPLNSSPAAISKLNFLLISSVWIYFILFLLLLLFLFRVIYFLFFILDWNLEYYFDLY